MIKYNNSNINDWNFDDSNIIKVYHNGAVCYYKITSGDTPTPVQEPCFAVVDDISQYSDTEFEDVFNKADEKWYKLNNLNQYEQYGIYGSGRTITTYEGKLTIDDGYEYQYSGGSWVNVGEVSGTTATLPNVPFTVNFNAKNYDSQTKTLLKTSGQLASVDAVITAGTPTVGNGYLTIASGTRATISGYQTYFNRSSSAPNLTIISKQKTTGTCHMFANRDSIHNWMYRCYSDKLTLHGSSEQGSITVTTQPVIESVRVNSSSQATYNNYTNNTSSTYSNFRYGRTNSGKFALFAGYASSSGEWFVGDFYWVYMSQNTLTDEQVQQVIAYNEGGGGKTEYPIYYDELQDPPDNVVFSSMVEAESYECPWVGMHATINGDKYIFSGDSQSGYEWIYQSSRLPAGYTEVEYVENTSTAYLNLGVVLYDGDGTTWSISTRFASEPQAPSWDTFAYLLSTENTAEPYYGFTMRWQNGYNFNIGGNPDNLVYNLVDNGDGTSGATITCPNATTNNNTPLTMFVGTDGNFGQDYWRNGKGKFYTLKVTKNNTLVRDLVPAKRDSDNKYGMYDLVTNAFYLSPNNINFVGGDPV